jgi:hypothetical protein
VSLTAPEATVVSDDVEPGKDVTYSGGGALVAGEAPRDVAGTAFERRETESEETSWVEIELKDDEGNPVPYESYKVVTPEGKIRRGKLDKDGLARVDGIDPGNCEITFPNLDKEGWGR